MSRAVTRSMYRRNYSRGSAYNNWINSLRSDYARTLHRRENEENDIEDSTGIAMNKVERTHWYIKDNGKTHHTIKYDLVHEKKDPKPVLRRGQSFYLALRFRERDFDLNTDRIVLNFKFGHKPSVTKDTLAVVPVANKTFTMTKDDWDCRIDPGTRAKDLVLQVYIPASAKVGIWHLDVQCGLQDRTVRKKPAVFTDETDIYILFNPWCKDDLIYIDDEVKREEYVMNDKGKVYVGAYRRARGRPWAFGQFDDVVLPVAMYILELDDIADEQRGNPVQVVRAISAVVNSSDEGGLLTGNWSGDYSDGVAPYKWTGSVRILEEYVKKGYEPVKYGQCWVFSALTTTICRTLGIPCRSVSNFVSAHDTNASLTIDKFFNKDGDEIKGGPDGENWDSIWNFHVWNDVWMARPDLPQGYGGWQCIDATPQERSGYRMQCGPASLEAIRRGDIGLGFDGTFVFAEVNADVMHWAEDEDSDWGYSRIKTNSYHVGRSILTKKPGQEDDFGEKDLEEILLEYKNKEGTEAERLAIHNAVRGCRRAQKYFEYKANVKEDVKFDLEEIDTINIGEQFKIGITIRNEAEEDRTVTVALTARSVSYNGIQQSIIKKAEGKVRLGPQKQQEIALTVEYNEYWKKLLEQCMIKMYVIARVAETGQNWSEEDDFTVEKPKMKIEVPQNVVVGKPCEAIFTFKNPLDEPLTEMQISVDGAGLVRPRSIDIPGTIAPFGDFTHSFKFQPRIHGTRKIVVSFNAKELYDITGSRAIEVKKQE